MNNKRLNICEYWDHSHNGHMQAFSPIYVPPCGSVEQFQAAQDLSDIINRYIITPEQQGMRFQLAWVSVYEEDDIFGLRHFEGEI